MNNYIAELSDILTTNMANFLAVTYRVPSDLLEDIFLKSNSMDQRNFNVTMSCFIMFMIESEITEDYEQLSGEYLQNQFSKYFQEFLAFTVIKKYSNVLMLHRKDQ